jgi:transcriptional regulator GlxA family with amidase domain
MRLAHGHWSLHHTSMSIAQVAHVYKFSDASHFTRMHRLLYGLTTAQARLPEGVVGHVLAGGQFIFH